MFPQAFPYPQIHFPEVAPPSDYPVTDVLIPFMYDDNIFAGDLLYDYLANEANAASAQITPDWFGYSLLPEYTYDTNHLFPASPSSSVTSPSATDTSFPFSPSPSPSPSQTSSTPEHHQASPQPSHTTKEKCRKAEPVYNHIRGKWCCSGCGGSFRGRWECKRHIKSIGKRAVCLACGSELSGARDDSRDRHLKDYCKGNVANFRFEDAFAEV